MNFDFEVFMHSTLAEPLCCAIVELILVERQEDGVVEGEYSAGWAQASRPHKTLQPHVCLHDRSLSLWSGARGICPAEPCNAECCSRGPRS